MFESEFIIYPDTSVFVFCKSVHNESIHVLIMCRKLVCWRKHIRKAVILHSHRSYQVQEQMITSVLQTTDLSVWDI